MAYRRKCAPRSWTVTVYLPNVWQDTGEIDPDTGRKVRLHLGHIVDRNLGGKDVPSKLRTLCSTCNQGAKNITHEKPLRA